MTNGTTGIHHITAISTDPQSTVDFYTGVLGLRLVKWTVNYDDPATYHFYFGDEQGRPGTLVTFFAWPTAARGRIGTSQAASFSFSIPAASVGYWVRRLERCDVKFEAPVRRFEEDVLVALDPDGLPFELVAHETAATIEPRAEGLVPAAQAVRGLHAVTFSERAQGPTVRFLCDVLGMKAVAEEGNRMRFACAGSRPGRFVDVIEAPSDPPGVISTGTIHHVALRARNDREQEEWRQVFSARGVRVTNVRDRSYFRSIYLREPGGVLLEIATDEPGFAVDEPAAELGRRLMLPPNLESMRDDLQRDLPRVRVPEPQPEGFYEGARI